MQMIIYIYIYEQLFRNFAEICWMKMAQRRVSIKTVCYFWLLAPWRNSSQNITMIRHLRSNLEHRGWLRSARPRYCSHYRTCSPLPHRLPVPSLLKCQFHQCTHSVWKILPTPQGEPLPIFFSSVPQRLNSRFHWGLNWKVLWQDFFFFFAF